MSTKQFNMKGGNTQFYGGDQKNMFSKITSNVSSYLTMKNFVIIGALTFFILISVYYYNNHVLPKLKPSFKANNELMPSNSSNTNGSNEAELFLFYADWCPHCKTAKPIWNEIKDEYENKTINGYNVVFTEVNCTTESAEVEKLMNKYKVEGFPTIKLLKDGQVIEYDAKPSRENLTQFLNTVL
jgi:thiol-disulfide isomerase/thioredoxin